MTVFVNLHCLDEKMYYSGSFLRFSLQQKHLPGPFHNVSKNTVIAYILPDLSGRHIDRLMVNFLVIIHSGCLGTD